MKNAVVKQGTNNVAVLTTAVQEGGKEYTVTVDGESVGKFTGIASVIPTAISLDTQGVQGVIGKEVTLKATVTVPDGQSKAGIPVTFNVDGANNSLNKDYVAEAYTDESGVATYTYTQYNVATDEVIAYPTGNPSKRATSVVYWGVADQLTVKSVKDAVNGKVATTNDGSVSYTGTAVSANGTKTVGTVYVNIAENLDSTVLNNQSVVVIDNNTNQRITLSPAVNNVPVKVDSNGNYGFTIVGSNQEVTPVVWIEKTQALSTVAPVVEHKDMIKHNNDIAVTAPVAVFGAAQAAHTFTFDRTAQFDAPANEPIRYRVTVKTADGKPYVNSDIKVRFSEDYDQNLSTNTRAFFVDGNGNTLAGRNGVITVKTNAEGVATFYVESDTVTDHTAPQVWIDVIGGQNNQLDTNEPSAVAPRVVFVAEKFADFEYDTSNDLPLNKGVYATNGIAPRLIVSTVNQNGSLINGLDVVTYVVKNNGSQTTVTLNGENRNLAYGEEATFRVPVGINQATSNVAIASSAATSLSIEATGRTTSGTVKALGTKELTFVTPTDVVTNDGNVSGKVAGFGTSDTNNGLTYGYVIIETAVGYKTVAYNENTVYRVNETASTANQFEQALTVGEEVTVSVSGSNVTTISLKHTDSLVSSQASGNTAKLIPATRAELQALIEKAEALTAADYVSFTDVDREINEAKAVLALTAPVATVAQLTTATQELQAELDKLVLATVPTSITKAEAVDADKDGTVDGVILTFTKAVDLNTVEAADFRFTDGTATNTGVTFSDNNDADAKTIFVSFNNLGTATSATTTLEVSYAPLNSGSKSLAFTDGTLLPVVTAKSVSTTDLSAAEQKATFDKAIADYTSGVALAFDSAAGEITATYTPARFADPATQAVLDDLFSDALITVTKLGTGNTAGIAPGTYTVGQKIFLSAFNGSTAGAAHTQSAQFKQDVSKLLADGYEFEVQSVLVNTATPTSPTAHVEALIGTPVEVK